MEEPGAVRLLMLLWARFFGMQEARKLLETVLAIQPRLTPASGGGGAKSSEQLALEVGCLWLQTDVQYDLNHK